MASQGYWDSGCEGKFCRAFRELIAGTSLPYSPHDSAIQWQLMSR